MRTEYEKGFLEALELMENMLDHLEMENNYIKDLDIIKERLRDRKNLEKSVDSQK